MRLTLFALLLARTAMSEEPQPVATAVDDVPAAAAHAYEDDPITGEELNLDYPVEAQPDTAESRTALRFHIAAYGGLQASSTSSTTPATYGPAIAVGKPLYLFTRHRHGQGIIDTHIAVGYALSSRQIALTMSPTIGFNAYFGSYLGLEGRAGLGFGAQLSAHSAFGVGVVLEGYLVGRFFADDRTRLKLGFNEDGLLFSSSGQAYSGGPCVAFEMAL